MMTLNNFFNLFKMKKSKAVNVLPFSNEELHNEHQIKNLQTLILFEFYHSTCIRKEYPELKEYDISSLNENIKNRIKNIKFNECDEFLSHIKYINDFSTNSLLFCWDNFKIASVIYHSDYLSSDISFYKLIPISDDITDLKYVHEYVAYIVGIINEEIDKIKNIGLLAKQTLRSIK